MNRIQTITKEASFPCAEWGQCPSKQYLSRDMPENEGMRAQSPRPPHNAPYTPHTSRPARRVLTAFLALTLILVSCFALPFWPGGIEQTAAYADDESLAPITRIETAEDLFAFAASVNSGVDYTGLTISLENDIELTSRWTPIGTRTHPFRGTFDGKGHTISGLDVRYKQYSEETSDVGFFGRVSMDANRISAPATIENLTLAGLVTVADSPEKINVGGLVGSAITYDENCAITISGCAVYVDVTSAPSQSYVGGLAGELFGNSASIIDCLNYGDVTVRKYNGSVGGIAGMFSLGNFARCGNYGSVTVEYGFIKSGTDAHTGVYNEWLIAAGRAGGLVGFISLGDLGEISECFNKGAVTGMAFYTGGLIGHCGVSGNAASGRVRDCYNTGEVSMTTENTKGGYAQISGLVGQFDGSKRKSFSLENAYNTGALSSAHSPTNGEINPLFGLSAYAKTQGMQVTTTNCYEAGNLPQASDLGAKWQNDANGINGGAPLLLWEDPEGSGAEFSVRFDPEPENAFVRVYRDAGQSDEIAPAGDAYLLRQGKYYYTAAADSYVTQSGSFSVAFKDLTLKPSLRRAANLVFSVTPADAEFVLADKNGTAVTPSASASGVYAYGIYQGDIYTYTAKKDGYNGARREIAAADASVRVALTESVRDEAAGTVRGGQDISNGGAYRIERNASAPEGAITIKTKEPVTLIGEGTIAPYESLSIASAVEGANLTLVDVFISSDSNKQSTAQDINILDFPSGDNRLMIKGVNMLELMAPGYGDKALIHVPRAASLSIVGDGTLYFYKHQAGAAIGGDNNEMNGKLTFDGPSVFGKGSKQGAVIGAGANTRGEGRPGDIIFRSGTFTMMTNSRGSLIGAAAGDGGASAGGNVYIYGGTFNLNVDYSGAAIGGGGYESGNDSDGGNVYIDGGSIRTYIDLNAAGESLWPGVTGPGVNDTAITATKLNADEEPVYLLSIDTAQLDCAGAQKFTVVSDGKTIYAGGPHAFSYINENTPKGGQREPGITMDNWVPGADAHLYVYLTGTDHAVTVNGEKLDVKWNAARKSFSTGAEAGDGGGDGDGDDRDNGADTDEITSGTDADHITSGTDTVEDSGDKQKDKGADVQEGTGKKALKYTVKFNANGGKALSSSAAKKNVTYGNKYGKLSTPKRAGLYKFKGWYTKKSGGSRVTATSVVKIKKNTTLYAQWKVCYGKLKAGVSALNVRNAANANTAVKGWLYGKAVRILSRVDRLGKNNDWYRVRYQAKSGRTVTGFVNARYIKTYWR